MNPTIMEERLRVRNALARGGVNEATLEADLLLGHTLNLSRSQLYASLKEYISEAHQGTVNSLVQRRLRREPLAYILGNREFFGLEFKVFPGVFIPRPETETLVEQAICLAKSHFPKGGASIADIGTGCGAVAVSLAKALPYAHLYATDISETALAAARSNAKAHGAQDRIVFLQGDLLCPLPMRVDIVLANLPYIRSDGIPCLDPEVSQFEPREALDGGLDGLDLIRRLIRQCSTYLRAGGAIVLEMDPDQMDGAASTALEVFPLARLKRVQDLSSRERALVIRCHAETREHPE